MNINSFKEGDIIMRNEGVLLPDMNMFGMGSGTHKDTSWVGEKMEFIGVENGKILLIKLDCGVELQEMEVARGYDEGWTYYPTSLFEKAKKAMKKYAGKTVDAQ